MDLVAVGWIALQMTGSPFMVAVAAFARSAPMMALGAFAGIVADRVSRTHLTARHAGRLRRHRVSLPLDCWTVGSSVRRKLYSGHSGGDRMDVSWT